MVNYPASRLNMVECQLRTNKVTDEAVLDAFLSVPRERFVPPHARGVAYVDEDIPLGRGRALMEPMVLARLLQLAGVTKTDKALVIGCATGYAAALLAPMAAQVTAVESDTEFANQARVLLAELGCGGVGIVQGPLEAGWRGNAPYDVIVIDGGVAQVPPVVAEQLAEGGRLVTVMKPGDEVGQAVLMTRAEGVVSSRPVFDAAVTCLAGFARAPSFVF